MDSLEAIEQLKDLIEDRKSFDKDKIWDRDIEALKIGIAAIEKRIPKKPYFREEEGAEGYACPSCDMDVMVHLYGGGFIKLKYCNCGQTLDWGEDDE